MATKSKRSRYKIGYKVLACVLCLLAACCMSVLVPLMTSINMASASPNFAMSTDSEIELEHYSGVVLNAYRSVTDAEIKTTVDDRVDTLKQNRDKELQAIQNIGGEDIASAVADETTGTDSSLLEEIVMSATESVADEFGAEVKAAEDTQYSQNTDAIAEYKKKRIDEINKSYSEKIANLEEQVIENYKRTQADTKRHLETLKGMYYVIYDLDDLNTPIGSNLQGDLLQTIVDQKARAIYAVNDADLTTNVASVLGEDFTVDDFKDFAQSYATSAQYYSNNASENGGYVIAVAFSPELYQVRDADYYSSYKMFGNYVIWLMVCIAVFITSFVWLMYTAGKNPHDDSIKIGRADIVFLDIGFVLLVIALVFCISMYMSIGLSNAIIENGTFTIDPLGGFGLFGFVIGGVCTLLLWACSLSRRIKNGTAAEFTFVHSIFGGIKSVYDKSTLTAKDIIAYIAYLVAGIIIFSMLAFGGFLGVFAGIVFLIIHIVCTLVFLIMRGAGVRKIERGVTEIKNGNTEYVITPTGNKNLDKIVSGINNITEGLSAAVQREVKAERMRTELITNISHDLKTPLTSILTYVDLLKKEPGLTDEAQKYLEVLDVKSHRLKALTDDLFEAAKAQSGDINVELTRIELVQFMAQALGELSDRIDQSGLIFVTELPPEEKIYVMADGKLLFRVVGNIVDNAIKYSIPGSRVYFNIALGGSKVCMTFKNISKDELNITEDELMERFVRGDSSRNTEGSGLGLAIAKNFMQLMNGEFVIEIDGDLFKAKLNMDVVV